MSCQIIYNNQKYSIESFKDFLDNNKSIFLQDFISQDIEGFKEFLKHPQQSNLREQLALKLAADYSFAVEINTAKESNTNTGSGDEEESLYREAESRFEYGSKEYNDFIQKNQNTFFSFLKEKGYNGYVEKPSILRGEVSGENDHLVIFSTSLEGSEELQQYRTREESSITPTYENEQEPFINFDISIISNTSSDENIVTELPTTILKSGTKVYTLRTKNIQGGIIKKGSDVYNINNLGKMSSFEALTLRIKTPINIAEVIKNFLSDIKDPAIRENYKNRFINGKEEFYMYEISHESLKSDKKDPDESWKKDLGIDLDVSMYDNLSDEEIKELRLKQINILISKLKNIRKNKTGVENPLRDKFIKDRLKELNKLHDTLSKKDYLDIDYIINDFISNINKLEQQFEDFKKFFTYKEYDFIESSLFGLNEYIKYFNSMIESPEQRARVLDGMDSIKKLLSDLTDYKYEAGNNELVADGIESILEGGEIIPSDDIGTAGSFIDSVSQNSKNKVIQWIGKKFKEIISNIEIAKSNLSKRFNPIKTNLTTFMKSQGVKVSDWYDFMIETEFITDEHGNTTEQRTGNYVIKNTKKYNDDLRKAKELGTYQKWQFIANHNNMSISASVLEKLKTLKKNQFVESWTLDNSKSYDYYLNNVNPSIVREYLELNLSPEEEIEFFKQKDIDHINAYIERIYDINTITNIFNKLAASLPLTSDETNVFNKTFNDNFFTNFYDNETHSRIFEFNIETQSYISEKYSAIQNMDPSDPRRMFYEFFVKEMKIMRRGSPVEDYSLPYNYIPNYYPTERKVNEDLISFYKRRAKDFLINSIAEREETNFHGLDVYGNPIKRIPFFSLVKEDPRNKSYDLAGVLEKFADDYYNYKYKSENEDMLLIVGNLIKNQKVYIRLPNGKILIAEDKPQFKQDTSNNAKQTEYAINAFLYGEQQDKGSILLQDRSFYTTDAKIKYDNLVEQLDKLGIEDDRKIELLEMEQEELDKNREEDLISDTEELFLKLTNDLKQLESREKLKVTEKKAVNSLLTWTAVKSLGFNFLGFIWESIQGVTSGFIEAASGRHFSDEDFIWAVGENFKRLNPANRSPRMSNLNSLFNVVGEINSDVSVTMSNVFFIQYRIAKEFNNNAFLLAQLKHRKVDLIDDTQTSFINIIDFDEVGNPIVNKAFDGLINTGSLSQEDWLRNEIINESVKFKQLIFENRDRNTSYDQILGNSKSWGRLLGQFKSSWMIQGFNKRFEERRDGIILGETEGYYRSFGRLFLEEIEERNPDGTKKTVSRLNVKLGLKRILLFSKGRKFFYDNPDLFKGLTLEDFQVENISRALREFLIIATIMTIYTLISLLRPEDPDDEDKESLSYKTNIFLANVLLRTHRDLTAYISPDSYGSLIKNSIPALSTIDDFFDIIWATKDTVLGDPYLYEGTAREELKVPKRILDATPVLNQVPKIIDKFERETTYSY